MSDFEFRDDAEIKAVFKFEVGREQNDHNLLYNKSLPNQHPIEAITGLNVKINELNTHIADKNNPHDVTKAQVGLGNVDNTSDLNKPISTATQSALDLKVNTADLGNAELNIQKNGTSVGKFTANASTDKVINLIVPTQASDVNALPDTTKYGASLSLSINSSTFVVTAQLKDQDGGNLGSAQTIDLPLESVVVNGTYDSINKKIVLTLENGNTVDIPVGDLIAGLQSEITVDNKLSADLVDDSSTTNKFVTSTDKITWDAKQDALVSGTNIKTINNTAVLGSGNFALADQSLSNLDSNGQKIIDSQNGTISNCVLDIPQNLKLELSNNVLTLKSGSVLTRRGNTYETYTTTADNTRDLSTLSDGIYYVFSAGSSGVIQTPKLITKVGSDSSLPADNTNYNVFYLTTDKFFYLWDSSNSWNAWAVAYPICLIKAENNVATFAKDSNGNDMIFNGVGFIGHHAFVYPGVKGYSPEGWTGVHHLNSNVYVNSSLKIIELDQGQAVTGYNRILGFNNLDSQQKARFYNEYNTRADAPLNNSWRFCYIRDENQILFSSNGTNIIKWHDSPFIEYNVNTDNVVTDFTIRQPVRTATVEMLNSTLGDKQADLTTVSGFDATATQVLKNINGVLTWVTEE